MLFVPHDNLLIEQINLQEKIASPSFIFKHSYESWR